MKRFNIFIMGSYIVLTAVGSDRPGLVDEISSFLAARKINIEDSRMAVLGGEFAVVLLASGAKDMVEKLGGQLAALEKNTGLSVQVKSTVAPQERKITPSMPHRLVATSMDHPGIVHEITRILHKRNINIESMETRVTNAPLSGAPIFNMRCVINIPVEEKASSIRRELEKLGDRMDIDIEIEAVDTFQ
ncbi:MAG: ACT domain-containing protein [Spirochaetes bacterium]|nr:ACT domain-containing protein [Spirochaetota bacterium]